MSHWFCHQIKFSINLCRVCVCGGGMCWAGWAVIGPWAWGRGQVRVGADSGSDERMRRTPVVWQLLWDILRDTLVHVWLNHAAAAGLPFNAAEMYLSLVGEFQFRLVLFVLLVWAWRSDEDVCCFHGLLFHFCCRQNCFNFMKVDRWTFTNVD